MSAVNSNNEPKVLFPNVDLLSDKVFGNVVRFPYTKSCATYDTGLVSHDYDDEATEAAIREVLAEQKRETSRIILPELSPYAFPDSMNDVGPNSVDHNITESLWFSRLRSVLSRFVAMSPKTKRLLLWLMFSIALLVFDAQLFVIAASLTAFSLLVISIFLWLVKTYEYSIAAVRDFGTKFERKFHPDRSQ